MPIADYVPEHPSRPDEFEADETGELIFPCCACKHQHRPEQECFGCCHYAN